MYHNLDIPPKEAKLKSLYVKPRKFENQLKFLKKLDYDFVDSDYLDKESKKSILLTFDDAFKDFYKNALPILKKYKGKAIVFVPVNLVGTFNHWDYEKLNVKKEIMDWNEIKDLVKEGIEIGSHTLTHPFLTKIPISQAKSEIEDSKKILEDKLGIEIKSFCYPYGDYNEKIKDLVIKAGYKYAFTTKEGSFKESKDLFEIKRITISGFDSLPRFLWKVMFWKYFG